MGNIFRNMSASNSKDEKWFWDIIQQSRGTTSKISHDRQLKNLTKILSTHDKANILEFDRLFRDLLSKSYNWDLWGAAYIINGGCSDDTFDYFRSWLIGQGESIFYKSIESPETLIGVLKPKEEYEWEGLEYCAIDAYEKKTGEEFRLPDNPRDNEKNVTEPTGRKWDENELPTRFPKLWKVFSEHTEYESERIRPKKIDPSKIGATFNSIEIPKAEFWINELRKKGHDVTIRLLGELETNPEKLKTENYAGYLLQLKSRLTKNGMGILVKGIEKLNGQVKIEFETFDKKLSNTFKDLSLILADQPAATLWTGNVEFSKQDWLDFLETGKMKSV